MKLKHIAITAASVLIAGSASAQFLAGWDFQDGSISTDLSSGYSNEIGSGSATLTSSDFILNTQRGVGNTRIGSSDSFWANNGFQGGIAGDNSTGSFGITTQGSFSFELEWDGASLQSTAFALMFSSDDISDYGIDPGGFQANTFSIEAFDGTTSLGAVTPTSSLLFGDSLYNTGNVGVNLSVLDGVSNARLVFTTSANTSPAGNFVFDNVAITGTVVPEPSSYAAIAGVLAIAFVAVRRRK